MTENTRKVEALGQTWTVHLSSSVSDDDFLRHGMPENLASVTDVVIDLPRGEVVTINGVEYSGTLYLRSRTYIVHDSEVGNRWFEREHYLDGQHLSRGWEHSWAPVTDAARRRLQGSPLLEVARELLADEDAVRDYWAGHFARMRGYRVDEAKRALETANRFARMARDHGADVADVAVCEEGGDIL